LVLIQLKTSCVVTYIKPPFLPVYTHTTGTAHLKIGTKIYLVRTLKRTQFAAIRSNSQSLGKWCLFTRPTVLQTSCVSNVAKLVRHIRNNPEPVTLALYVSTSTNSPHRSFFFYRGNFTHVFMIN